MGSPTPTGVHIGVNATGRIRAVDATVNQKAVGATPTAAGFQRASACLLLSYDANILDLHYCLYTIALAVMAKSIAGLYLGSRAVVASDRVDHFSNSTLWLTRGLCSMEACQDDPRRGKLG
jgi:hypothetical protein